MEEAKGRREDSKARRGLVKRQEMCEVVSYFLQKNNRSEDAGTGIGSSLKMWFEGDPDPK